MGFLQGDNAWGAQGKRGGRQLDDTLISISAT